MDPTNKESTKESDSVKVEPVEPLGELGDDDFGIGLNFQGPNIKRLINQIINRLVFKKASQVTLKSRGRQISKCISLADILQRKVLGLCYILKNYSAKYIRIEKEGTKKEFKLPCTDIILTFEEPEEKTGFFPAKPIEEMEKDYIDPKNPSRNMSNFRGGERGRRGVRGFRGRGIRRGVRGIRGVRGGRGFRGVRGVRGFRGVRGSRGNRGSSSTMSRRGMRGGAGYRRDNYNYRQDDYERGYNNNRRYDDREYNQRYPNRRGYYNYQEDYDYKGYYNDSNYDDNYGYRDNRRSYPSRRGGRRGY